MPETAVRLSATLCVLVQSKGGDKAGQDKSLQTKGAVSGDGQAKDSGASKGDGGKGDGKQPMKGSGGKGGDEKGDQKRVAQPAEVRPAGSLHCARRRRRLHCVIHCPPVLCLYWGGGVGGLRSWGCAGRGWG